VGLRVFAALGERSAGGVQHRVASGADQNRWVDHAGYLDLTAAAQPLGVVDVDRVGEGALALRVGSLGAEVHRAARVALMPAVGDNQEVDIGVRVSRLATGTRTIEPDGPQLVAKLTPERIDEALHRTPLCR
jgi:hypothetical protein